MFKFIKKILSLSTIFVFLGLSFLHTPAYAGTVTVSLSPSSGSIGQAEQDIYVNINTVGTAVNTVGINITYDPAILNVTFEQGTISEFNTASIPLAATVSNGVVEIAGGMLTSSYTGSGLLAVLKVRVLTAVTALQDTEMTIKSDSFAYKVGDSVPLTNQLTASTLGATSTFSADPDYVGKNLPGTAIFDDNRIELIASVLIGISLVYLGVRAIKIKAKNTEV